jgi:hypothetical protein
MIHRSKSFQNGQELAEFAITSLLLLTIIFFILDLGRAVYYYSTLQNAVREGARYGIIHPTDNVGINSAFRLLVIGMQVDAYPIQPIITNIDENGDGSDDLIEVCAEYDFIAITPFVQTALGKQTITMETCSSMQIEK